MISTKHLETICHVDKPNLPYTSYTNFSDHFIPVEADIGLACSVIRYVIPGQLLSDKLWEIPQDKYNKYHQASYHQTNKTSPYLFCWA